MWAMPAWLARIGRPWVLAALAALPWVGTTACVIYRPVVYRPATLGEELVALDQARKDGLLTDAEYAARRELLIAAWKEIGTTPIQEVDPNSDTPRDPTPAARSGT